MEIPRFGIGDQILHGANELTALLPDQYIRFETGMVYMTSFKVMAEMHMSYELLEDNIMGNRLAQYVLGEAQRRIAVDLERLIINGDTMIPPTTNSLLCMEDGLLKRTRTQIPAGRPSLGLMGGHIVDALGNTIDVPIWFDLERALPEKYAAGDYIYFTHRDVALAWRENRTDRPTAVGDQFIFEQKAATALGREVLTSPFVPMSADGVHTYMWLIQPKNIILGTYRNMRIESTKNIQKQKIIFVLSSRIGLRIEEPDAIAMVENLKSWPARVPYGEDRPISVRVVTP
jgi:HK97 family phage major capsid protein